jgi:HTH-type transcriptional regulator/antitoxin HipB
MASKKLRDQNTSECGVPGWDPRIFFAAYFCISCLCLRSFTFLLCMRTLTFLSCMRSLTLYIPAMQVKTSNDVGALVRDRRSQLAWSQQELASRVGVSRLWIVQLEKGKPTAQIGLALRTLKELGLALDASISPDVASPRTGADAVNLNRIIQNTLPPKS